MIEVFFALDPAGSRNSFTASCVGHEIGDPIWYILGAWAERPSEGKPLDVAGVVVPKMARRCLAMGCHSWMSDAAEQNAVRVVGAQHGIATLLQGGTLMEIWAPLRTLVHTGRLRAAGPDAAEALRQAALVTETVSKTGAKSLYVPSEGTEHCDDGTALARALFHARAGDEQRGEAIPTAGAWAGAAESSSWEERFPP